MIPINMPQVGQDLPTGTIVEWFKEENDPVEKDELILTVESEKATFDVEAEASGVLLKILYRDGEEVEVLKPVGFIGEPGETIDYEQPASSTDTVVSKEKAVSEKGESSKDSPPAGRINISPSARKMAKSNGIDISQIKGTGPDNRIIKQDIITAAEAVSEDVNGDKLSGNDSIITFGKMRKKIAQQLTFSKQTIPHFYLEVDVDVTDILKWRKEINKTRQLHLTVTDLITKASAHALLEYSLINSHVESDRMILKKDVNIGIAVSVDDGLLVPVIPNVDKIGLVKIAEISKENIESARRGSVNPANTGSFTISTLGMCAIKKYMPIINPPECAIIAVGSSSKQAVVFDENIVIRDVMSLTLAADHRGVDGVYAADFLNCIKSYLEKTPDKEWL